MTKKIIYFIKDFKGLILFLGIVFLLLVVFYQPSYYNVNYKFKKNLSGQSKEMEGIKSTTDIRAQVKLYKELIVRVGPEEAQDQLFRSGLPFTGETHLLNHAVGDYLYEEYGAKGLPHCKDYFLSSCYHGFILNAIGDGGMSAVAETFAECLKFGNTVSSQCAHGIGHGFLANGGYKNLVKALQTCDEASRTMQGFPVFNCYDGVFMENIWAVHDGEPSPDRWVKEDDPFYPCNDKRIDSKYMQGCWSNQPALAYQLFKGDVGKVAVDVCNKVVNTENKRMCFDGLSRQIHPLTKGSSEKTLELCSLMPDSRWSNYCVATNASASYSVGDREVPFEICASVDLNGKDECYGRVFGSIKAYRKSGDNLTQLCAKIKDSSFRLVCEKI